MKTIKLQMYIWAIADNYSKKFRFIANDSSLDNKIFLEHGYIPVAPYTIEIEMPAGLDYFKEGLKFLQNKRKLILANNEISLRDIDNQIQEFMAIENKETVEA